METTAANQVLIAEQKDKSDVVEINARMFEVKEFYLDTIRQNLLQMDQKKQGGFSLSAQDKEILAEAVEGTGLQKPMVKEGAMRAASLILCEIIEKQN